MRLLDNSLTDVRKTYTIVNEMMCGELQFKLDSSQ